MLLKIILINVFTAQVLLLKPKLFAVQSVYLSIQQLKDDGDAAQKQQQPGYVLMAASAMLGGIAVYYFNQYNRKKTNATETTVLREKLTKQIKEIAQIKKEREVLLQEVHHRVKNNLQMIISLLSLQSGQIDDIKAQQIFDDCKNRIRAIAMIHEKLYASHNFELVNFNEYLLYMVTEFIHHYRMTNRVRFKSHLEVVYFNLNTIVPLCLLVNEIISNSLRHAFKNKSKGELSVEVKEKEKNSFELIIGDNGDGCSQNPAEGNHETFGFELINILTNQLDGLSQKLNRPGTFYCIDFKMQKN